jgi:hypothetical protein
MGIGTGGRHTKASTAALSDSYSDRDSDSAGHSSRTHSMGPLWATVWARGGAAGYYLPKIAPIFASKAEPTAVCWSNGPLLTLAGVRVYTDQAAVGF